MMQEPFGLQELMVLLLIPLHIHTLMELVLVLNMQTLPHCLEHLQREEMVLVGTGQEALLLFHIKQHLALKAVLTEFGDGHLVGQLNIQHLPQI